MKREREFRGDLHDIAIYGRGYIAKQIADKWVKILNQTKED